MESKELGIFLEKLRGKKSLREIADICGLSHAYIRDLELGLNRKTKAPIKPSPDTLKRLAAAYNYSYEDLLTKAGYLTEQEKEFIDDLSMTDKELIEKYKDKIEIEGKPATEDELKKAINYIKFLRFSAK